MSTTHLSEYRRADDVPAESLISWADEVLASVDAGDDLCEVLGIDRQAPEYPDALALALPELTLSVDSDDVFGSAMSVFFPVASIIEAIGYAYSSPACSFHVPQSWGFCSGAAGNTWESARIPGDDAWTRLQTVANAAITDATIGELEEVWMIDDRDHSAALDLALMLRKLTGAPLAQFPDSDDESWEAALRVLLATGHACSALVDAARAAGIDY